MSKNETFKHTPIPHRTNSGEPMAYYTLSEHDVPIKVTRAECIARIDEPDENQHRTLDINGKQISVSEEVYHAYKRPLWAEHKQKEREKRCRDENGNRCMKDCSRCTKDRIGSILSLDKFAEEGFDLADPGDVNELVAERILLQQLYAALDELDPKDRRIAELYSIGLSEREIAAEVGMSQKGINKRKVRIFTTLHERLGKFV